MQKTEEAGCPVSVTYNSYSALPSLLKKEISGFKSSHRRV